MDKFSNLPEPLRNRILSRLPLEDAIRTSILSRKWANVCSSLSNLEFHQPSFERKARRSKREFKDFVNQMLLLHDELDIEKFSLSIDLEDILMSYVNSWISFAVKHNVKELNLHVLYGELGNLPTCLLSCNSLRVLTLENLKLRLPATTSIGFPKLQKLKLMSVHCSGQNLTNQLFSQCPVLEELFISQCSFFFFYPLRISSPKLKILSLFNLEPLTLDIDISAPSLSEIKYHGDPPNMSLETLSSLTNADFLISPPSFIVARREDLYHRASLILMGMQNVTKLDLRGFYIEFLSMDREFLSCLPTECSSLEHLKLDLHSTKSHIQMTIVLLMSYPSLKHLHLSIQAQHTSIIRLNTGANWQSEGMITEDRLKNLRTVKIEGFGGSEFEFDLLKFLVGNADTMEKMNIRCSFQKMEDDNNQVSVSERIAKFVKASPAAIINVNYLV